MLIPNLSRHLLSVAMLCFTMPLPATAQHGYIRRSIEKKYEQKAEDDYGKDGKNKANTWINSANEGKLKDSYLLQQSITYQNTSYKNGKPREGKDTKMVIYTNPTEKVVGMAADEQKRTSILVFDLETMTQAMFDTKNNKVFVLNMKAFLSKKTQDQFYSDSKEQKGKLQKLPNAKNLLGFSCMGYQYIDEDGQLASEFWVAAIPGFKGFEAINPALYNSKGTVLETTSYHNGEPTARMTATNYNKAENLKFVTADYERIGLPNLE